MNNRALILALNEHNQAIVRSRAEYAAHHRAVRAPGSRRRAA